MLNNVMLQAHRGVSTECPENTMSAFRAAVLQGYDIIELDPAYTADGRIVVLHDQTINRTTRNADGSEITEEKKITDITYKEAVSYDYGAWFSYKYKGEKLPLLSEVLAFTKESGTSVKLDNKIAKYPEKILDTIFEIVLASGADTGFTCFDIEFAKKVLKRFPEAHIHYDGAVSENILSELESIVKKGKLTVWTPVRSKLTSWVKVGFADKAQCEMIKKYARLALWIVSEYEEFEKAREYGAEIVETTGSIKPERRRGIRADMHNHTDNSHDAESKIEELVMAQIDAGNSVFAVTDHYDVEYCKEIDYYKIIGKSFSDASRVEKEYENKIEVLKGVEVGEAMWHKEEAEALISSMDFDVILGSAHAAKYLGAEIPFSRIDFSVMGEKELTQYIHAYFDGMENMIENFSFDILTHLGSVLKYTNVKYGFAFDTHMFEDRIEKILSMVIRRGIILEVNTAALGSKYDKLFAEEWILKRYREMGGYLISTGSDSHKSKNAGHEFDRTYKILKDLGFKNAFYVKNRNILQYTL